MAPTRKYSDEILELFSPTLEWVLNRLRAMTGRPNMVGASADVGRTYSRLLEAA